MDMKKMPLGVIIIVILGFALFCYCDRNTAAEGQNQYKHYFGG